jgi:hypothetical protein
LKRRQGVEGKKKKLKRRQGDEGKQEDQEPSQEDESGKPHHLEIYPSNFSNQA